MALRLSLSLALRLVEYTMSYSSSNHSSGRSVKFRDLEDGAGDASGSRTSSKMSAALSFDASVGLLSDASLSTTSSRRGRLGKPAPLRSVSSAAEANHLGDLKTSDDVIYLDAGHIVEHGSFEDLMNAKGTFYDQVNARGDE